VRDRFVEVAVGKLPDEEEGRSQESGRREQGALQQVRPLPSRSCGLLKWARRELGEQDAETRQSQQ